MLESSQRIFFYNLLRQIDGTDPIEKNQTKNSLSNDQINSTIEELQKINFVNEDKKTLTESGRDSLKVVLAGGVFDIIHPGHIHTLNAAKELGDVLAVVVATDNTAVKMKEKTASFPRTKTRVGKFTINGRPLSNWTRR